MIQSLGTLIQLIQYGLRGELGRRGPSFRIVVITEDSMAKRCLMGLLRKDIESLAEPLTLTDVKTDISGSFKVCGTQVDII